MKVPTKKRFSITGGLDEDEDGCGEYFDYHRELARSAFADMLHDTERNKKYHRALQMAIEKMHNAGKKANVLDIGTGTGLLSILAARCGADTITACEAFKPMADCCLKILEKSGVADKITVIQKRSTNLTVGEDGDMKQKANILVTEVFDTELIGEGAISTFTHAHKYLLEEDCIVVPDSAVIYAQVVECPMMQKWNYINDLTYDNFNVILTTDPKVKVCPGSASLHDLQLSQVPRQAFRVLSDPIPVLYYDWSGRSPIEVERTVKHRFTVTNTGKAQIVFMWWELNMDTEGTICLSCAPWWTHPDADLSSERPQDSIPWRDHWLQVISHLPQELMLQKDSEASLVACQDEYSLWFYLEDETTKPENYDRITCICSYHVVFSRTHISYLNDGKRNRKVLAQLKEEMIEDAVVLDLNASSFLGLAAAKMGARAVYIFEDRLINLCILTDIMQFNNIDNVTVTNELDDDIIENVTNIVCDPNYFTAVLPWENLKFAYLINQYRDKLYCKYVTITPERCEVWAMPVEFQDLHKIRIPVGVCEGIDLSIFDDLIEKSRMISDGEIEAQPLWEYPCKCRGEPRKLLEIDMYELEDVYSYNGDLRIADSDSDESESVNGFAVWMVWVVGGEPFSMGPVKQPALGERVVWDMHTRQAVKILKHSKIVTNSDKWSYEVICDLKRGEFDLRIDWATEEP